MSNKLDELIKKSGSLFLNYLGKEERLKYKIIIIFFGSIYEPSIEDSSLSIIAKKRIVSEFKNKLKESEGKNISISDILTYPIDREPTNLNYLYLLYFEEINKSIDVVINICGTICFLHTKTDQNIDYYILFYFPYFNYGEQYKIDIKILLISSDLNIFKKDFINEYKIYFKNVY